MYDPPHQRGLEYIVTCQAHTVLVKKRRIKCVVRSFLNFLSRWLSRLPIVKCLVAARAVCWRPRLAGTRQYI